MLGREAFRRAGPEPVHAKRVLAGNETAGHWRPAQLALGEGRDVRRDAVDHRVRDPEAGAAGLIVPDDREAARLVRHVSPRERRRDVLAGAVRVLGEVAGVLWLHHRVVRDAG